MGENLNVIIIDKDETSRDIIKNYLSSTDNVYVSAEFFDFALAEEFIAKSGKCIVLTDVSEDYPKAVSLIKNIKTENKDAYIVALSTKPSTETIIKIMRAGAKEFLNKPVIETEFLNLINTIKSESSTVSDGIYPLASKEAAIRSVSYSFIAQPNVYIK